MDVWASVFFIYEPLLTGGDNILIIGWLPDSNLQSGRSLAWDHVRGDIDDPCGAIADFCGVIADPCGLVAIPQAIGGRRCGDADRRATR